MEPDFASPATVSALVEEPEPGPEDVAGEVTAALAEGVEDVTGRLTDDVEPGPDDVLVESAGPDDGADVVVCGTLDTDGAARDGVGVADVAPDCVPEVVDVVAGCALEPEGVVAAGDPPEPVAAPAGTRRAFVACCT